MNRNFGLVIVLTLFLGSVTLFWSCQSKPVPVLEPPAVISAEVGEVEEPPVQDELSGLLEGQVYAPFTGIPVDAEVAKTRPVVVMLDNHVGARPQAGLSQADVVFEILAEGWITRYMAVFHSVSPDNIGPIRSSRMYYIQRALEFDPLYVHVGGSPEALKTLRTLAIGDVDGLKAGKDTFWRVSHKKIPHNMYSSMEAIRKQGEMLKHKTEGTFETWQFYPDVKTPEGTSGTSVKLVYYKPTASDKVGYYTTYTYDAETGLYLRGFNGKPHVDENDDTQLTARNIIIQYADHRIVDKEGRREVDVIGKGEGVYLTMGVWQPITWEKISDTALTRYYVASGEELVLNPGVTWIQVIENAGSVTLE